MQGCVRTMIIKVNMGFITPCNESHEGRRVPVVDTPYSRESNITSCRQDRKWIILGWIITLAEMVEI